MQVADEIAELEKYEKKWSKEAINEVNLYIKKLDKRDAILAPYISEIKKYFKIEKIIYKRKE